MNEIKTSSPEPPGIFIQTRHKASLDEGSRPTVKFQPHLARTSLGKGDSHMSNKGPRPFPMGDIHKKPNKSRKNSLSDAKVITFKYLRLVSTRQFYG